MSRYILRRCGQALLVVLGVVVLTFIVVRLLPGDPAIAYAGPRATAEELAQARIALGLDRPVPVQLWIYLTGILQGDLGTSIFTKQPVIADLTKAFPASLELVAAALVIAVPIGMLLGMLAARRKGGAGDVSVRFITMLAVSFPSFWLALILQSVLATRLGWFPVAGEYDSALDTSSPLSQWTYITAVDALITGNWPIFVSVLHHLVLPALVLAMYPIGVIAQLTRAGLVEELTAEHVRNALSLGFSRGRVIRSFALRPVASPVVTLIALVFAYSLVNAVIVESIFNWPGLGRYATSALRSLDTPAIAGVTLLVAIVYVLLNLLVDLLQTWIDPRVRLR